MRSHLPALLLIAAATTLAAQNNSPSFELNRDTTTSVTDNSIAQTVATGDFNNDGKLDLVIAGGPTSLTLTFRAGNGDGTFQPPVALGQIENSNVDGVAVADLNRDGNLDIVVASDSSVTAGGFQVFYGNGNGTFRAPVYYATPYAPFSAAVSDLNSDGYPDISIGDTDDAVEVWNNSAGASFVLAKSIVVTNLDDAVTVRSGQFDGDGINHLAAQAGPQVWVLWNDGHENFTLDELKSYSGAVSINTGRLAQDGRDDLLVAWACPDTYNSSTNSYVPCGAIDAFYGQGAQKMIGANLVTDHGLTSPPFDPLAIDVNGDGIADIVAALYPQGDNQNDPSGLYVWPGYSGGSFAQSPIVYAPTTHGSGAIAAGDFNRDGMMDFAQTLPFDQETEIYINGAARPGCATKLVNDTVTECYPVDNTYSPATVFLYANAYDGHAQVTDMQVYADNHLEASQASSSIKAYVNETPGAHFFVTKAWDAAGLSYRTDRTITVFNGTPGATCPAAQNAAAICVPSGSTAGSPTQIVANGWTSSVPTAAQLYIDGTLVVNNQACNPSGSNCYGGTSYVDTTQNLSAGTHSIDFKLWDNKGNVYTAQKTITVQ